MIPKKWKGIAQLAPLVASLLTAVILFSTGCQHEVWETDPDRVLRFSADTLFFDTVFTTVGSVTLPLKVYNDYEGTLLIDEIELESGGESEYRVNVNGAPMVSTAGPIRDVPVLPGDSLYIFVEVTVDPDDDEGRTPFWVIEDLRFYTNTVEQIVTLIARGQNAVFHGKPGERTYLACDETWTAELPHVLYGQIVVEPGCQLTIEPGARIHGHDGAGVWVRGGTLTALGELDNPIVFEGDRLDDNFQDDPGQWGLTIDWTQAEDDNLVNFTAFRGGIWLDRAVNCEMDHVEIKEATIGLWVDSIGNGAESALNIRNSIITNAESIGLLSQGGFIRGHNNLVSNCGQACGYFAFGGNVQMHLSTFANYSSGSGVRQFPSVYINDWYEAFDGSIQWRPFAEGTEFRNCIMTGNNATLNDFSEVVVDFWDPTIYNGPLLTSCAIQHQDPEFPAVILDENTSVNLTPPFYDVLTADFHLEGSSSSWEGVSSSPPLSIFDVSTDLDGNSRNTLTPTKGCYERIP